MSLFDITLVDLIGTPYGGDIRGRISVTKAKRSASLLNIRILFTNKLIFYLKLESLIMLLSFFRNLKDTFFSKLYHIIIL